MKKCRKFVLLKIEIKQQIASFLAITDYTIGYANKRYSKKNKTKRNPN